MGKIRNFLLSPMAHAIRMTPLLLLASPFAAAVTVIEGTRDIDSTAPLDSYRLNANARLNATGASLREVNVGAGAQLNMQA